MKKQKKILQLSEIKNFFKSKQRLNFFLTGIFLVLFFFFSFSLRDGPINLNSLDKNIENNVYSNIQEVILNDVNIKYSNLNDYYKKELLEKEFEKVKKTRTYKTSSNEVINIDDMINSYSTHIKSGLKTSNRQTYLNAIDPYHFLLLAVNYYKNEHSGNFLDENNQPITYREAPKGHKGSFKFKDLSAHSQVFVILFNIFGIEKEAPIEDFIKPIFLVSTIFGCLAVVFLFLFLKKYAGFLGAGFGSLFLTMTPIFISRTVAGFSDTDGYVMFFPIIIFYLLFLAFTSKRELNKYIFASLSGVFISMFLHFWAPGTFIFIISLVSIIGFIIYKKIILFMEYLKNKEFNFKKYLKEILNKKSKRSVYFESLVLGFFLIFSVISSFIFNSTKFLFSFLSSIFEALKGFSSQVSNLDIFANISSSIAELNKPGISAIFGFFYNFKILFLMALVGLVLFILNKSSNKKIFGYKSKNVKIFLVLFSIFYFTLMIFNNLLSTFSLNNQILYILILILPVILSFLYSLIIKNYSRKIFFSLFLTIYFFATFYLSLNGTRFIMLLAVPVSIMLGLFVFTFSKISNDFYLALFDKKPKNYLTKNAMFFLIGLVMIFIFISPFKVSQNYDASIPNFDDDWFSAMKKIEQNSSKDAIITSWWDFGHFFTAVSNRGTTFDGGSQTGWTANLVGKLLLEKPEVSYEILKMLQCSHSRKSFDYILNITKNENGGINIYEDLLFETFKKSSKDEKREVIENYQYYNFSEEQINDILNLIDCENPKENFVIVSSDMIGKAGVWTHWGLWDYSKKYISNNYNKLTLEEISKNINLDLNITGKYIKELNEIDKKASLGLNKKEDLQNQWFAPYLSYLPLENGYFSNCDIDNFTISCLNGILKIDMINSSVQTEGQLKDFKINNIYSFQNSATNQTEYKKNNLGDDENGFDVILVPAQGQFRILIGQSPLGESLFTRLYFLNGIGLEDKFKFFDYKSSQIGNPLFTYKVIWD